MVPVTAIKARTLGVEDAASVARLARHLGGSDTDAQWATLLERPATVAVGALIDGRAVGYAAGQVRRGFGLAGDAAWLEEFGVELERRGAGVGRELLGELLRRFAAGGATHVYTLVPVHDQVLAPFFRQLGFRDEPLACLGRTL